jgi:hypothetical protein
MGKIILEFDSVEESIEAKNALDGTKWKIAMWDLDQKLRAVSKHGYSMFGNFEASDEELKVVKEIRDVIWKILNDSKLDLED